MDFFLISVTFSLFIQSSICMFTYRSHAEAEKNIRLLTKAPVVGCSTLEVVNCWPQSSAPLLAPCVQGRSIYQEHLTHPFGR